MIWTALKQTGSDIWEEILNLLIFNVITLVGTVLIIPWPFVTFGLFEMAYDIGQGKGVKFSAFFRRAAGVWRQAYVWGFINLGVIIVVLVNVNFYGNFVASWAGVAQVIMLGIAIFWFGLQLIMLPLYPRLEDPGFKIALRNAAVLVARYPLPSLTILLIVGVMVALTLMVQQCTWFVLLGIFSFTAVLCNRMVGALVKKELGDDVGRVDEKDMGFNLDDTDEA
jgi:hypothetical protein